MKPYDIYLHDAKGEPVGLTLENGARSIGQSFMAEEASSVVIRASGKRLGEFDEQSDWKGGRGGERLSHDPSKYFDAKDCWTLSPNHVIPTIQWKFARGLRDEDFHLEGSKSWKPLLGDNRYVSVSFSASASYTTAHAFAWLRRRGAPGDLTMAIYSDSGGEPNAALDTGTVSSFDDILSVLHDFELAQALTGSTTYHVVLYSAATDSQENRWEVAVDETASGYTSSDGSTWASSTFSPYYRLTDADVDRRFWMFTFYGGFYAVDRKADGTASQLYINGGRGTASSGSSTTIVDSGIGWTADRWIGAYVRIVGGTGVGQTALITDNTTDTLTFATLPIAPDSTSEYVIYGTPYWSEIGTTGLGVVTGCPVSANGVVYFPQGSGDNIREMQLSSGAHAFDDNGTNTADVLLIGQDAADGPQVWRGLANAVSRATVTDWGTDLSFNDDITIGDTDYNVTNMVGHNGQVYVLKPDSIWAVSNDRAVNLEYGIKAAPDANNGQAAISHNKFLYFNWLWSTQQDYGGTLTDIGQGWRGPALPDGREGPISSYEAYIAWLFASVDAGDNGASSILAFDGFGWHEIVRAYEAGRRIRNVKVQACADTRNRLWFDCGGDLLFQVWPLGKANPLYDNSVQYMHEAVIESAAIDMGTASRLPKFIGSLVAFSKNLGSGIYAGVSYQVDDLVGSNTWTDIEAFSKSPEDEVLLNAENIGRFAYRLILSTNNELVPPDIQGVVPSGFARSPFRKVWSLRLKVGEGFTRLGTKAISHQELVSWLYSAAMFPGRVTMRSDSYSDLDGKRVVVIPPDINPTYGEEIGRPERSVISIRLIEV